MKQYPCKDCMSFTSDIVEISEHLEIELPLCESGLGYFELAFQKCENFRERIKNKEKRGFMKGW